MKLDYYLFSSACLHSPELSSIFFKFYLKLSLYFVQVDFLLVFCLLKKPLWIIYNKIDLDAVFRLLKNNWNFNSDLMIKRINPNHWFNLLESPIQITNTREMLWKLQQTCNNHKSIQYISFNNSRYNSLYVS